jgi:hypothetical protein
MRAYAAVTAAYWAFMLSDGALRMLVLLHFNALGFTPVQLAWLFLLYEVAGIVTNLAAGWLAARFGLAATLYGGLALQIGRWWRWRSLTRLGRRRLGRLRDGGAGRVGRGQGSGQDVVEIRRQAAGPQGGWRPVPLGGAADRVEERGQGAGLLPGRGAAGAGGVSGGGLGHGGVLAVILLAVVLFLPAGLPGRMKSDEAWGGWRSKDAR